MFVGLGKQPDKPTRQEETNNPEGKGQAFQKSQLLELILAPEQS